jgi:hypothetical protein
MNALIAWIFAEFALLALTVPGLTTLRRTVRGKLALALALPALASLPLVAAARLQLTSFLGAPADAVQLVVAAQALALAFSTALCGAAALAGRRWPLGGPAAVTVLALCVLTSPVWGDTVLLVRNQAVMLFFQKWLVAANPLFSVAMAADFQWTHAAVLYNLSTRIGEDLVYDPAPWRLLAAAYAALGLVTAAASAIIRQRGRPAEFLLSPGERL